MTGLLIASVCLLLLVWLGWSWAARGRRKKDAGGAFLPAGTSAQALPLLTEPEASFYNLLRLAAQDHYLVFAQVPLWSLVDLAASDRSARGAFLSKIALKRVDFVLVHPGTRIAAKVVELEEGPEVSLQRQARNRLVDTALKAAGIDCIRLKAPLPSTVPSLAALLGIQEET